MKTIVGVLILRIQYCNPGSHRTNAREGAAQAAPRKQLAALLQSCILHAHKPTRHRADFFGVICIRPQACAFRSG